LQIQLGNGSLLEFDNEGRLVMTRYPAFSLFNVYFPNGQRDHGRLTYKLGFLPTPVGVCAIGCTQEGQRIIICGDFNTAHREIDLRNPKQNENTSGFLPEERAWIDQYLAHGFVDAYRFCILSGWNIPGGPTG
jgi:exodeoxyribonuclease III